MMGCPRWHAAVCGALASFAFSFSAAPAARPAPTISVAAVRTATITNQPPTLPAFPKPAAAKPTPEHPAPPRAGTAEALEDGDRVLIPKQPSVVNVFGTVFNEQVVVISPVAVVRVARRPLLPVLESRRTKTASIC